VVWTGDFSCEKPQVREKTQKLLIKNLMYINSGLLRHFVSLSLHSISRKDTNETVMIEGEFEVS